MVSVITPAYNSSSYIEETVLSVLNQTYKDFEYLIIDDASTDNTAEIIKEFAKKDKRIKLICLEKNQGAAIARNKGIEAARGTFIAFIDSDDKWCPDKLEVQTEFMKKNNYNFTFTDYYILFGKEQKPFNSWLNYVKYKDIIKFNYIACSTVMFNQEKTGKVYMPNIRNRQDWGLWIKLLGNGEKAVNIPDYLMCYKVRKDSISGNKVKMIKYHWYIYRGFLKFSFLKSMYYLTQNIFMHIKYKRK